jgi:hypothetical protein
MATSHDRISERAHQLWEQAGKPNGRETEDWLQAEREIKHSDTAALSDPHRGREVEPLPHGKPVNTPAPHSTNSKPAHVSADALHHRRNG